MKKIIINICLLIVVISCLLIYLLTISKYSVIVISILCSFVYYIIGLLFKRIVLLYKCIKKKEYEYSYKYDNEDIRVSFSYLIKIKIADKYLLIKSNKFNRYQPIGGVYHFFDPIKVKELGFASDNSSKDCQDIRGKVKGKNLKAFVDWFNGNDSKREIGAAREFYEEMVEKRIIDISDFLSLDFVFEKRIYQGIQKSVFYDCYELLLFDIFELKLNNIQTEVIMNYYNNHNDDKLYLATADEIRRLGVYGEEKGQRLSTHTPYIL